MADDPDDFLDEFEDLGIDVDNIVHVILIGQVEFIGEVIEDKYTKDYIFLNPIKVIRDSYIDQDGSYLSHSLLVGWNPCIKDEFIFVKPSSVVSISRPNEIALEMYLDAIKEFYYADLFEEEELEDDSDDSETDANSASNNVIDFQKYLKR